MVPDTPEQGVPLPFISHQSLHKEVTQHLDSCIGIVREKHSYTILVVKHSNGFVQVLAACMSSISGTPANVHASQQGVGTSGTDVRIIQNAIDLASLPQPAHPLAIIKVQQPLEGRSGQTAEHLVESACHHNGKPSPQPSSTIEQVHQVSTVGATVLPPSPLQDQAPLARWGQRRSPSSASQSGEAKAREADQSDDTLEDPFGPAVFSADTGSSDIIKLPNDDEFWPAGDLPHASLLHQEGLQTHGNLPHEYGQNEVRNFPCTIFNPTPSSFRARHTH